MKKETIYKVSTLIAILTTIIVNTLANLLPINNLTTAEISDSINIYFVPAGYVFSIWGLIYLGLLIYAFKTFKKWEKVDTKIFPWVMLASLSNIVWIFFWHYELIILSLIPMTLLLISLIIIYIITETKKYSLLKRIPFQIYLGWISVATIANFSAALYVLNWNGFGVPAEIWSVVLIGVATTLSILITSMKKDIYFTLVILWAVVGILYKFYYLSDLITGATLVSVMAIGINTFANTYCCDNIIKE